MWLLRGSKIGISRGGNVHRHGTQSPGCLARSWALPVTPAQQDETNDDENNQNKGIKGQHGKHGREVFGELVNSACYICGQRHGC